MGILGENWDGSTVFIPKRFSALIQSSAKSSNLQSMLLDLFMQPVKFQVISFRGKKL